MYLDPSQRIKIISKISKKLGLEIWSITDLTLEQFGCPTTDLFNGASQEDYIVRMISDVQDDVLIALATHLELSTGTSKEIVAPQLWTDSCLRLFVSHLTQHQQVAADLKSFLLTYGVDAFVAHADIKPSIEWRNEIELALSTCDVLIAMLHEGFNKSEWTDQEVGFAIGRRLPVLSIQFNQPPYGFIGRFQAFNGNGKSPAALAKEVFDMLCADERTRDKVAESVIAQFESSGSFKDAKFNISLLENLGVWTQNYSERIESALKDNSQISGSYGVPARVKRLVSRWSTDTF